MGSNSIVSRLICFVLAIGAALLIVVSVFGSVTIGTLKSHSYVASKFVKYDSQLLETVNDALLEKCDDMPLPAEAFASALNVKEMDSILTTVARNIILCYELDFTDSKELYNYFVEGLGKYCEENGIKMLSEDINRCACYAVDVTNEVLTSGVSNDIAIFRAAIGKSMAIRFIVCFAIAIVFIVLIDLINRGRHRKFSYIGMAFVSAGMIFIAATLYVKSKGYVDSFSFCSLDIYNSAIRDSINSTFFIYPIIGAVFVVLGLVILIMNYIYFRNKNLIVQREKELNIEMKQDFIQSVNAQKGNFSISEKKDGE